MDMTQYRDTEYYITKDGGIWSSISRKFLKHQNHKRGYLSVSLMINGKRVTKMVHIMVAECWIPNPLNLPQIDHKDCNKHNPHADNLEWVTKSENIKRAINSGMLDITRCGTNNGMSRKIQCYKDNKIIKFDTVKQAADSIGISRAAISRALTGKSKTANGLYWEYQI